MASQPPYQSFVTLYFTEALPRQTNYSVPFFKKKNQKPLQIVHCLIKFIAFRSKKPSFHYSLKLNLERLNYGFQVNQIYIRTPTEF